MFKFYRAGVMMTPANEALPATAGEEYAVGEALKLANGAATKASGTDAPAYIAQGPAQGGFVPAVRVSPEIEWETTLSAAGTALKVGDKVTLSADGLGVTATTASGVAEITNILDTAAGGTVRVRL